MEACRDIRMIRRFMEWNMYQSLSTQQVNWVYIKPKNINKKKKKLHNMTALQGPNDLHRVIAVGEQTSTFTPKKVLKQPRWRRFECTEGIDRTIAGDVGGAESTRGDDRNFTMYLNNNFAKSLHLL